jgi:SAM-dependent methyltransferase
MTKESEDGWAAGDAYEAYMGRWSRLLARAFLEWLRPAPSGNWLELGCGTGALTAAICEHCRPASVVACDTSLDFLEHARRSAPDGCTFQLIAGAEALPSRSGGFDVVVSGLVLNFVPEPARALAVMRERLGPAGSVAAYVWDYAGGVELLQLFWEEAARADPNAAALDERVRFGSWQAPKLASLFEAAGFGEIETGALEITTQFADFDDYWRPFLGGSGPAPSYVATLAPAQRERLRAQLERRLVPGAEGQIRLRARAWAVRGSTVAPTPA